MKTSHLEPSTSEKRQNKPSTSEKRQNKVKYMTSNSLRLRFVKKTSMSNLVKSLSYIKCYSSSTSRPAKSPSNSIRYNCLKIYSWLRRPKTIPKKRKKIHISQNVQQTYYLQVFQTLLTTERRLTGWKFLAPTFLNTGTQIILSHNLENKTIV